MRKKRHTRSTESGGEIPLLAAPTAPTATSRYGAHLGAPLGAWASYGFAALPVYAVTSAHQHIEIVDLPALASGDTRGIGDIRGPGHPGRAYRLDGRFMASLADAHICHECMVHPLLLAHGHAQRVLILGGGDGGSAREALRHPGVTEVVVAELDAQVPATLLQYMPALPDGAFDDPRTTLVIGDARDLVDAALARGERFDAVVFDLTEADGDAASLHDAAFFAKVRTLLTPRGGIALQLGAPWFEGAQVRRMLDALRSVFRHVMPLTAYVPLYGTQWALAVASDALDAHDFAALASAALPPSLAALRHYSPSRHAALFDIPPELRGVLGVLAPSRESPR
ncbi:polyamine aminopropyltransferase [Pandoraea anhela]|uniref:Polyamine aminopropyltransferase n=1 Tax=Pandoraea anhela TaxID=2508295 RepID=A0A5E4Y793_9BURK|nr:polyamine aminopropyltransferase [Pandoraea anhela]VVE44195.1 spermidine synthase [Pandoraea anhela]